MNKINIIIACALLSGCASSPKDWVAVGGSRADGVVVLSYEYGQFENPVANQAQGLDLAIQRCGVWGYTGAEPFGGSIENCIRPDLFSCALTRVTKEFQCTGDGGAISR